MVNPTGYTALDLIGYTDKGAYSSSATYVKNDLVHYNNKLWRCLIDDTSNVTPSEGVTWTIFVEEPGVMTGATSGAAGTGGTIPAPAAGDQGKFFKGDGTWDNPPLPPDMTGATSSANGTHGLIPAPTIADRNAFFKGDGSWSNPTAAPMTGATASADGTGGSVPAPIMGDQNKVFSGAGTYIDSVLKDRALEITLSSVSSLPQTVSNANVESDMVVIKSYLSNPAVQTGEWSVSTSNGSFTVSGSISGTTNITLYFLKKR